MPVLIFGKSPGASLLNKILRNDDQQIDFLFSILIKVKTPFRFPEMGFLDIVWQKRI